MRILKLLCRVGIHSWVATPATYEDGLCRVLAIATTTASRECSRCHIRQIEDIHCLGLNPPEYVSTWRNEPKTHCQAPLYRTVKYMVIPGYVRSATDGQPHFISVGKLIELYGVKINECVVQVSTPHQSKGRNPEYFGDLIPLRPRADGDYSLPKLDINKRPEPPEPPPPRISKTWF